MQGRSLQSAGNEKFITYCCKVTAKDEGDSFVKKAHMKAGAAFSTPPVMAATRDSRCYAAWQRLAIDRKNEMIRVRTGQLAAEQSLSFDLHEYDEQGIPDEFVEKIKTYDGVPFDIYGRRKAVPLAKAASPKSGQASLSATLKMDDSESSKKWNPPSEGWSSPKGKAQKWDEFVVNDPSNDY
jgi:hypothetical protein